MTQFLCSAVSVVVLVLLPSTLYAARLPPVQGVAHNIAQAHRKSSTSQPAEKSVILQLEFERTTPAVFTQRKLGDLISKMLAGLLARPVDEIQLMKVEETPNYVIHEEDPSTNGPAVLAYFVVRPPARFAKAIQEKAGAFIEEATFQTSCNQLGVMYVPSSLRVEVCNRGEEALVSLPITDISRTEPDTDTNLIRDLYEQYHKDVLGQHSAAPVSEQGKRGSSSSSSVAAKPDSSKHTKTNAQQAGPVDAALMIDAAHGQSFHEPVVFGLAEDYTDTPAEEHLFMTGADLMDAVMLSQKDSKHAAVSTAGAQQQTQDASKVHHINHNLAAEQLSIAEAHGVILPAGTELLEALQVTLPDARPHSAAGENAQSKTGHVHRKIGVQDKPQHVDKMLGRLQANGAIKEGQQQQQQQHGSASSEVQQQDLADAAVDELSVGMEEVLLSGNLHAPFHEEPDFLDHGNFRSGAEAQNPAYTTAFKPDHVLAAKEQLLMDSIDVADEALIRRAADTEALEKELKDVRKNRDGNQQDATTKAELRHSTPAESRPTSVETYKVVVTETEKYQQVLRSNLGDVIMWAVAEFAFVLLVVILYCRFHKTNSNSAAVSDLKARIESLETKVAALRREARDSPTSAFAYGTISKQVTL